ncbi:hypothetical protein Q8A73_004948 [Channa argus]|nr:hypothetical protein Q8A73_004948 [Channa argus]
MLHSFPLLADKRRHGSKPFKTIISSKSPPVLPNYSCVCVCSARSTEARSLSAVAHSAGRTAAHLKLQELFVLNGEKQSQHAAPFSEGVCPALLSRTAQLPLLTHCSSVLMVSTTCLRTRQHKLSPRVSDPLARLCWVEV